uniref:Uncharacterized protein n=2 Tax=Caenorhabditis japonica TaxID=281687 RepID=A0A8R1I619_CAEJA
MEHRTFDTNQILGTRQNSTNPSTSAHFSDAQMQKSVEDNGGRHVAPNIPPRTHPIHLRNRLKLQIFEQNLSVQMEPSSEECQSRKASSVGFVEIDDLLKFQEEYNQKRSSTSSFRFCSSLRHLFSTSSTATSSDATCLPESHINPMFNVHKCSFSRSFTHLPYPPKQKRKTNLRRVFSCFSIFKH